jgi:hypothetical protein
MKIQNVNYHDKRDTFAVSFDDGITIILDEGLNYKSMLSVGLGSSFLKTGKWPTRASIDKRVDRGRLWIEKNKSRYKKYKK